MPNVFSINKQHIYENKILQVLAQFAKRTLKYRLNTNWAASSKVLVWGYENILCNQRACNEHSNLSNIRRGWRKNVTLTKGTRCANKHDRAMLKYRRTANRCKTHHSFPLCPVFRSLGYLSFLHYLFARESTLEWHPKQSFAGKYQLESA